MNSLVLFHPPTDENRELFLVGTIDALLHFAAAFTPTVPALVTADASKLAMRAVDEFVLVLVAPVAEQDGALQELLDAICLSITFYCGSLTRVKEDNLSHGRQGMQAKVAQVIKRSAAPLIDRLLDGSGQICPLGAVGPVAWTGLPRNVERPFIHAAKLAGRAAAVARGYCGCVVAWKGSVLCADLDATLVRVVLAHLQPEGGEGSVGAGTVATTAGGGAGAGPQDSPPISHLAASAGGGPSSPFTTASSASPAAPLSLTIPTLDERFGPDSLDSSSPRYATPHLGSAQPAARGRAGDVSVGWVDVHVPGHLMAGMAAGPVVRTARVSDQQPAPPAVTASRSAQALHPAVLWTLEIGALGVAVLLDPMAYGGAGSAACGAQATAALMEALEADVRRIHHELKHGLTAWSRQGDYADTPFPAATAHPQPIFHPPGYVLHSHHHHRAPGSKLGVLPSLPADAPPSYNHLIYDRTARTAKGGVVHRSVDLDSRFLSGVSLGHELFTVPPGGLPISQVVLRDHTGVLVARNVFGTETYVHAYAFPSYAAIEGYASNPEVHARNYLRSDLGMMML